MPPADVEKGGRTLEAGMVLLAPPEDVKGPQLFFAVTEHKLVAAYRDFTMKVERHFPTVPDGWVVLDGQHLAAYLVANPDALNKSMAEAI